MKKKIKNILVTGNLGYVGSVLTHKLVEKDYNVIGFDAGLYDAHIFDFNKKINFKQIRKDIRLISDNDLDNIDAVIHLAALSNDPLGEFSPSLTEEINYLATTKLIDLAKQKKISRFIFASSQSMYGLVDHENEVTEDEKKNPLTAYAETKMKAENYLISQKSDDFVVCAFRPSTVFGASPKFRSDIVFNNLMSSAYTKNKIEIKSDGSPWRPVVHVEDVSDAFLSGILANRDIINGEVFNVGFFPNGNYKVIDLAKSVKLSFPKCELSFTNEHSDNRSYRVSFSKIHKFLGEYYKPSWSLNRGAKQILSFFKHNNYNVSDFNGPNTTRLIALKELAKDKKIDNNFYFI